MHLWWWWWWVGEGQQHRGALRTDCLSITGLIQTDRCSYTQVCTSGQLKDFPHLRVLRNERNHFAPFKENMDMVRLQIGSRPTSNMEASRWWEEKGYVYLTVTENPHQTLMQSCFSFFPFWGNSSAFWEMTSLLSCQEWDGRINSTLMSVRWIWSNCK